MSDTRDAGARTTEPNLRELTAELDGLRELMLHKFETVRVLMDERHAFYKERDDRRQEALAAALVSSKEQTHASFEASEKAIIKAEEAQRSYNQSHNDLARKMDEQNKATIPRTEAENRFRALEQKIDEARSQLVAGGGRDMGGKQVKDESRANIALSLSLLAALLGVGGVVVAIANAVK